MTATKSRRNSTNNIPCQDSTAPEDDQKFIYVYTNWEKIYSLRLLFLLSLKYRKKLAIISKGKYDIAIYFFPRGYGNELSNLIGFLRSPDFLISAHGHGEFLSFYLLGHLRAKAFVKTAFY